MPREATVVALHPPAVSTPRRVAQHPTPKVRYVSVNFSDLFTAPSVRHLSNADLGALVRVCEYSIHHSENGGFPTDELPSIIGEAPSAALTASFEQHPEDMTSSIYRPAYDAWFASDSRIRAKREETAEKVDRARNHYPPDFERWWACLPNGRKVGKEAAYAAWCKLKPDAKLANQMIVAMQRQAAACKDPKYFPMPATWLNQHRWLDGETEAVDKQMAAMPSKKVVDPKTVEQQVAELKLTPEVAAFREMQRQMVGQYSGDAEIDTLLTEGVTRVGPDNVLKVVDRLVKYFTYPRVADSNVRIVVERRFAATVNGKRVLFPEWNGVKEVFDGIKNHRIWPHDLSQLGEKPGGEDWEYSVKSAEVFWRLQDLQEEIKKRDAERKAATG